ncbi:COG4-domain-containing [Pyrrhoderma noxium]|uniref:Conserved oligomeric Golgi complex subunit 4 n=1 Tax=Pyrrhoderma noxium TaxID=2282107 RepID=A0A286UV74_9AGAM|nr:COG4-domain-containing [Pyrrhoderma noxium]
MNKPNRPQPKNLSSLSNILESLSSLEIEENELQTSLTNVLSNNEPIQESLSQLRTLNLPIQHVQNDVKVLSERVHITSKTAERVGSRVRRLDEEMKRVREAMDRVIQVMELKTCLSDMQNALEKHDWETATRLCARAMSIPKEIIDGQFAGATVPTADSPLPPEQTLQNYRTLLRDTFLEQFKEASEARDSTMTTRFFKLLPPIGWENEGLEAYASFVLDLVQTKSPASTKSTSALYYVTSLTALFESICSIVDQHQPVVEKYYGTGKMQIVVTHLIKEGDKVVKRLLSDWEDVRHMNRKLSEISMYTSVTTSISRRPEPAMNAYEEQNIDPKDIDKVLNEVSALVLRFTAFRKFLLTHLHGDMQQPVVDGQHIHPDKTDPEVINLEAMDLTTGSRCKSLFEDIINKFYIPLETWFLRYTISQAHRTSLVDSTQFPRTSTVPDLAFYILKSVLTRLLSMGSLHAIKEAIVQIKEIMENEYALVFKRKLDDVYRNTPPGSISGRTERSESEKKTIFLVMLNDLDVSSLHLERLIKDIVSSQAVIINFLPQETQIISSEISTLLGLSMKLRSYLKGGIDQFFNQLIRPRLRTLIPDVYKDISYTLEEEGYANADYQDLVRKRFVKFWDSIFEGFKELLTESNYRLVFSMAIDVLVRPWEKYILTLKYSELGAIRFDQDLRSISTYLSTQVALGDIRERLQRLQQISTLLNIDKDEDVNDFFSSSGIAWKLNLTEARSIASLKV